MLLNQHFDRLERVLMPLFNGDALPEVAKSVDNLRELLESGVAFRVKFAVLKKLVHRLLLALLKHLFEQAKSDLGHEQFVVVPVVTLHLRSFLRNLLHTAVVRTPKLVQLGVKFISFV